MSDLSACPCCGFPTLRNPGAYETCKLCDWQDDGEGGDAGTGQMSLAAARRNFQNHGSIHGQPGAGPARRNYAREELVAYALAVRRGGTRFDPVQFRRLLDAT